MKFHVLIGLTLVFSLTRVNAQTGSFIRGTVLEKSEKGTVPLPGAGIVITGSGTGTISDEAGTFSLKADSLPVTIVVSYTGFETDTILVKDRKELTVTLNPSVELKAVEVTARQEAVQISTMNTLNVEKITQRELLKAACCNLSEAFETNPTITVAYRDAVTGAKEIRLLGLAGIYSQLLTENIQNMRGLAGIYGLTYIPGPWMESIQVTKGTGSVVNGFESTTGQINVEFKKPFSDETPSFFLNLFTDNFGGHEVNTFIKKKVNDHWSGILMAHGKYMNNNIDRNKDGFMDMPNNQQMNLYNRWHYDSGKKMEAQIGVKFLMDDVRGGQLESSTMQGMDPYMTRVYTRRAEVFAKMGFVFPEKPLKSFGNIFQLTLHDMNSEFGHTIYNADQRTLLYQGIYQNILWKSNHQYKTGISYRYDELNQRFFPLPDKVTEHLPGVFFEYTYNYLDKFTFVAGAREDVRNSNESIFTPRFHAKYNFTENSVLRFSAGRSYRRPFVIADHISVMATSRQLIFTETLQPEKAWNYGVNYTRRFRLNGREGSVIADAYRTDFINQVVVDTYTSNTSITFSNLEGTSYSNSVQLTINYELIPRLDVRLAYKLEDVHSTYNKILQRQPMVARDRAMANISYANKKEHWKFDFTTVWEGRKPLQNVFSDSKFGRSSPDFVIVHSQVTKVFRKFELYAGAENLLDFRQSDPVLLASDPHGAGFDATNVWGPIAGRRIYGGIRFSIR